MPLEPLTDSQLEEWVTNFRKSGGVVHRTPDPATYVVTEATVSLLLETRRMLQVTNQLLHFTNRLTLATYILLAATIVLLIITSWQAFVV